MKNFWDEIIHIEDTKKFAEIKKALKEELVEHSIKHSSLEFEVASEECTETL